MTGGVRMMTRTVVEMHSNLGKRLIEMRRGDSRRGKDDKSQVSNNLCSQGIQARKEIVRIEMYRQR